MRQLPETFPSHLPLSQVQKINEQCNRFESAWKAGQRPRIEEYLTAGPAGSRLLLHLILLDIDCRRGHGESPQADDYLVRFPTLDRNWLTSALAEFGTGAPGATLQVAEAGIPARAFLARLGQGGLLPADELQTLRARLEASPGLTTEALARELVSGGKLVEYQARALAAPVAVPFVLGPYVLDGWIASGGMGNVFRATHERMKRVVAVKVVQGETAARPDLKRRFQREVEVAARLRHPNIVTAFDAGEQDGVAYLVTEFVDGEDLGRLVKREGPVAVEQAVSFVRQAALGLAYAHAQGIIHRDVKPSNLILGRDGLVRVLDVGLASAESRPSRGPVGIPDKGDSPPGLTEAGMVLGTADYMAPEQAEDPRRAGARSDVYSLGCTLYYLLTGKPPYQNATAPPFFLGRQRAPVPSLRAARSDVPADLDQLFQQMAAEAPADRPTSMAAVLKALDGGAATLPRRLTRRRLLAATGAAALAVVAGVVALRQQKKPLPADPPVLPPRARLPFNARVEQQRWADALGIPVTTTNVLGMQLVLIPPGSFARGTSDAVLQQLLRRARTADEAALLRREEQQEIIIHDPFYMSTTEVTVGQFRNFVEGSQPRHVTLAEEEGGYGWHPREGWRRKKGCSWQNADQMVLREDHPVGNLTWSDAQAFCRWLSNQTRSVCRLPTEAEWEYACRAGSAGLWSFGDDEDHLPLYASTGLDRVGVPQPVARKSPNAFGLFDMHGNLLEWCQAPEEPDERDRPPGRPGPWVDAYKPVRGGDFRASPERTRSAARSWQHPNEPGPGIRVLQVLAPPS